MLSSLSKKRGQVLLLSLILLAALACREERANPDPQSQSFAIDQTQERGPLVVHVRVDANSISIAETLLLQFEATLSPGYTLEMPRIDGVLRQFGILDWDNLRDRLDDQDNVVKTSQYRLEPFLSGTHEIPSFLFRFADVNDPDATYTLETDPIEIEVTSLLGEERENLTIADIDDVVEMPRPPWPWWVWLIIGLFLLAALLVTAYCLWLRSRPAKAVRIFKSAHEIAYERLRRLVDRQLIENQRVKEFYEHISTILRHYIEDRFDLRAPEQTTEEFLSDLKQSRALAPADKESLEHFLAHCDLVKFAKHHPDQHQIQDTFDLAKAFVEKTQSESRMIDITDRVQRQASQEGAA